MIQSSEQDDMIALVKVSEKDKELRKKLFDNMSDNSRKNFEEEVEFRYKDEAKEEQINAALLRLTMTCNTLKKEEKADI